MLLLDEPLAALDVSAAPAVRALLRDVLRSGERIAFVVTHDVLDALALADRAVVIEAGHIAEAGTVRDVLSRPRSDFAARIAGLNLLAGEVVRGGAGRGEGLTSADGVFVHGVVDAHCGAGDPGVAVFAPHAVAVYTSAPEGSPRNVFEVTVRELEARGSVVLVTGAVGATTVAAEITAGSAADLDLVPGARVHFVVKATEVAVHARK
ncbi:TOBE domain-containing protein [Rhodococcus triatomae]|uniref:TOBE domain-containing protein n=1 Tax=Rhodococcus triatomae TaxID=300028 RepID=UPI003CCD26DC